MAASDKPPPVWVFTFRAVLPPCLIGRRPYATERGSPYARAGKMDHQDDQWRPYVEQQAGRSAGPIEMYSKTMSKITT